jgi:hypothetical protein
MPLKRVERQADVLVELATSYPLSILPVLVDYGTERKVFYESFSVDEPRTFAITPKTTVEKELTFDRLSHF